MKNLMLTTALVLSTATFAQADSSSQLALQVDNALASMNIDVDIDSLSDEQISALYSTITSDSGGDKRANIEATLNDNNVMFEPGEEVDLSVTLPRSQMRSLVRSSEVELGIQEVSLRSLSDDQLARLYAIAHGGGSGTDKQEKAKAVIN